MRLVQNLLNWLRSLVRKSAAERELGSELRFHIERQAEENIAAGMTAQEARRAAMREFGGVEQVKEECRDTRRVNYLENLSKDIRYGVRMLRKSPSFTFFAVTVLALGIAANSAIFSVADNVLVRPLPYRDSERLVISGGATPARFAEMRDSARCFTGLGAYAMLEDLTLSGGGEPEVLKGIRLSASFLQILGVDPIRGRGFRPERRRFHRGLRNPQRTMGEPSGFGQPTILERI